MVILKYDDTIEFQSNPTEHIKHDIIHILTCNVFSSFYENLNVFRYEVSLYLRFLETHSLRNARLHI